MILIAKFIATYYLSFNLIVRGRDLQLFLRDFERKFWIQFDVHVQFQNHKVCSIGPFKLYI